MRRPMLRQFASMKPTAPAHHVSTYDSNSPFFKTISPREHMRRSDPTLILLPLLSIIQSAQLGKQRNGQKEKMSNKQINNSSLSDNCTIEMSLSHVVLFYLIWPNVFVTMSILQSPCLLANNLWVCAPFYQNYSWIKQKQNCWLELLLLCMSLQRFVEYNHFKIQAAQLPEEHEYFTLCKWGLSYEFLDGSDYDTVISEMVMWWWLSLLCPHQRLSITAHAKLLDMIRKKQGGCLSEYIKHWQSSLMGFTHQTNPN